MEVLKDQGMQGIRDLSKQMKRDRRDRPKTVLKLNKSVYGVPDAGQAFSMFLQGLHKQKCGLSQSEMDPCIFFRITKEAIALAGVLVPPNRVVQVSIAASQRSGTDSTDLNKFRPQRHLEKETKVTLLPFGGGERVCLGKSLSELEIRLLTVGLLKNIHLSLFPNQNLTLKLIPSPSPEDELLVEASPLI